MTRPPEAELPPAALGLLASATRHATPCGDGEIVWRAWGEGKPLALLHGGSGSWTHWIRNVEALAAAGRRVLVPDLPGFGESARPPGGQDADSVLHPLAEGLRELAGDAPCDVAGFSFGGLCGVLMAASYPQRVDHLVLLGAPGLGLRSKRLALASWRDLTDPVAVLAAHRKNLATLMLYREEAVDALALAIQSTNLPRDRMHRRKLALTDIVLRTLPTLTCRVDAIYGEQDALYRGMQDQLLPLLSRAPKFGELVFVPDAGHWVQYEEAQDLNRELLRLLQKS